MRKFSVLNYILGSAFCSLGVSFCTKAGLGLSMIGAPPYILHVWGSRYVPAFTQGTAEYVFQAIMLLITVLVVRRFRWKYLLSFATAVFNGLCIDGWLYLLKGNGVYPYMPGRILAFAGGCAITALGVAFFFRTDLPLQVYELLVAEVSDKYNKPTTKVKLVYDICMLALALALSLGLTRKLTGIGIGTVIVTFANAPMISFFGKLVDKAEGLVQPDPEGDIIE